METDTLGTETKEEAMNVTTENKFKPKKLSLVTKIIACTLVIVCHFLMWFGLLPNATSAEICACGFTLLGIFGTVDVNLALDKFAKNHTR